MADNITVTSGSYSAVVATDEIASYGLGAQVQRIKPVWGVDGAGIDTSATNPLPVVQTGPLTITTLPALPSGASTIGAVTQSGAWSSRTQDASGNAITSTAGALDVNVKTSAVGSLAVTENGSIAAGQANVVWVVSGDYSYNETLATWTRNGGATWFSYDLDESEEDIKTSAGRIWGYTFSNLHATLGRWLRFYNATAASTTVGSTAALFPVYMPPGATGHLWFGKDGPVFSTALCAAATGGTGVTDATAIGADEVMLTVWYK